MTKLQIKEVNTQTGEEITRDATTSEIEQLNTLFEKNKNEQAELQAKAQAKATAEGKLAALGLTTDDLRALGL
jgi:hypothetical protein